MTLAPNTVREGDWFLLLDPAWHDEHPDEAPPVHVIAGGWKMAADGTAGPFEPNPDFFPSNDTTATDPTDAAARFAMRGEKTAADVMTVLRDAVVEIACDDQDYPLIGDAPDGTSCVLVVTAPRHREGAPVRRWRRVQGSDLPDTVPDALDILLNPAGPAPLRISTARLRSLTNSG